jgi:hypothetical protein
MLISRSFSSKIISTFCTLPTKTAAFALGPEIISGYKIGQDGAAINMSHLSFKISLLRP